MSGRPPNLMAKVELFIKTVTNMMVLLRKASDAELVHTSSIDISDIRENGKTTAFMALASSFVIMNYFLKENSSKV